MFFFCERGGNDVVDMTTVRFPELKGKIEINFYCEGYCPRVFMLVFISQVFIG